MTSGSRANPTLSRRRMLGTALVTPAAAACGALGLGDAGGANPAAESGRVILWYSPTPWPFDQDVGAQFVREFGERYPNIQIALEQYTGNTLDQLITRAAAATLPDIAVGVPPHNTQELGVKGILAPVEGFMKTSRTVRQADIWPSLLKDMIYKGKQYSMPFGPDVRVNYVHCGALSDSGLSCLKPATMWDEMEEHTRRVVRLEQGRPTRAGYTPFWGSGGTGVWLVPFWQLGGELTNADGDKVTIDNEKGIQALEWLKRIHDAQGGYQAMQELQMRSPGTANARFIQGVTACTYATFAERKNPDFLNNPGFQFGYSTWPLPKGGKRANYGGDPSMALTTGSKAPAAAWRFIEFMAEEKQSLRFATRYDRIPIRIKTAESAAYQQNDPFLKLAVEEMRERKWIISVPGGAEISSSGLLGTLVTDVMAGKRSVRDALKDTQVQLQVILDKYKK